MTTLSESLSLFPSESISESLRLAGTHLEPWVTGTVGDGSASLNHDTSIITVGRGPRQPEFFIYDHDYDHAPGY